MSLADHDNEAEGKAGPAQQEGATVYVCITCRPPGEPDNPFRPGELLAASAAKAAEQTDVRVLKVKCLGVCNRPPTAAMRGNGSWTYVFSGLELDGGADLVAGARLLAKDPAGLLPWQGRPKPLKRGMVARVPPLYYEEESE